MDIMAAYDSLRTSTHTTVNGLAVIHQGWAMRLVYETLGNGPRWEAYTDVDAVTEIVIVQGLGSTPLEAMIDCVNEACKAEDAEGVEACD